jgi:solute carrier family 12 sodium/potassium/chloride transporter 2
MNVGVTILRLQEGLDCSEILADIDDLILNKLSKDQSSSHQAYEWSVTSNGSNFSPNPDSSNGNFKNNSRVASSTSKNLYFYFQKTT